MWLEQRRQVMLQLHLSDQQSVIILDLTPDFNGLGEDNCRVKRETFQFWDLVNLILEVWQYMRGYLDSSFSNGHQVICPFFSSGYSNVCDKIVILNRASSFSSVFTHWGLNWHFRAVWSGFSWRRIFVFWFIFYWFLFLMVQVTMIQYGFM